MTTQDEFPILLAAKAGGKLRAGIHHRANGDNASKVILTLGRIMGLPLTEFGKDEGYVSDEVSELRM